MKIYSRKALAAGLGCCALAGALAAANHGEMAAKEVVLLVLLLLFGADFMVRALSRKRAAQDRIEELDERNRLIRLQSKSRALQLTEAIAAALMLLLLIAGAKTGYDGLTGIGVGLAAALSISFFSEIFTNLYYENRKGRRH